MWEDLGVRFTQESVHLLLWQQYTVVLSVFAGLFAIYWYRRIRGR
jgi:hypothetical protein